MINKLQTYCRTLYSHGRQSPRFFPVNSYIDINLPTQIWTRIFFWKWGRCISTRFQGPNPTRRAHHQSRERAQSDIRMRRGEQRGHLQSRPIWSKGLSIESSQPIPESLLLQQPPPLFWLPGGNGKRWTESWRRAMVAGRSVFFSPIQSDEKAAAVDFRLSRYPDQGIIPSPPSSHLFCLGGNWKLR